MEQSNVCLQTVTNGLCIGCGVCAGICPSRNLAMQWNSLGEYNPVEVGKCVQGCRLCLDVCPFQEHEENEDSLGKRLFGDIEDVQHTAETGYYANNYVGYVGVGSYRTDGSSGGVASWFLNALLGHDIIDEIACVTSQKDPECLYRYEIFNDPECIKKSSKSAYYPIEISEMLRKILERESRYAIVCLPCTAKALRLACLKNRHIAERIKMIIGLTCGQMKSKLFADFCVRTCGGDTGNLKELVFRVKDSQDLSQYGTKCTWQSSAGIKSKTIYGWSACFGKVWSNFAFTPRPCLQCDDVFSETADVAFMDAWLPEYEKDWRGTSIIIARNRLTSDIIEQGIRDNQLVLKHIGVDKVIQSQAPQLLNKRKYLAYRLFKLKKSGEPVIQKRVAPNSTAIGLLSKLEQNLYIRTQKASGKLWLADPDTDRFVRRLKWVDPWAFFTNRAAYIIKKHLYIIKRGSRLILFRLGLYGK